MGQDKRRGNVILVGLMGAGKTTVGRALARKLGRTFFDSDHEIEARTGVKIPTIFEHEGEDGFRVREAEVIDDLTQRDGIVLATGGGAVLRPENRERLKTRGTVVYLCAHPHDLWLRTRRDKSRPLLQTDDPRGRLEALFAVRDPIYRDTAHCVMETGRPSINSLTASIISQLGLDEERLAMEALQQARVAPPENVPPAEAVTVAGDLGAVAPGPAAHQGENMLEAGAPGSGPSAAHTADAAPAHTAERALPNEGGGDGDTAAAPATAAVSMRVPVQASLPFDIDESDDNSAGQPGPDTGLRSAS